MGEGSTPRPPPPVSIGGEAALKLPSLSNVEYMYPTLFIERQHASVRAVAMATTKKHVTKVKVHQIHKYTH